MVERRKESRNGWHSSKFHLALITMGTVTVVFVAMGMPVDEFKNFTEALLFGAGIYSVARVGETAAQVLQRKPQGQQNTDQPIVSVGSSSPKNDGSQ